MNYQQRTILALICCNLTLLSYEILKTLGAHGIPFVALFLFGVVAFVAYFKEEKLW